MQTKKNVFQKLISTVAAWSVWGKIFAVLTVALFFLGIFTLGSAQGVGKGYTVSDVDTVLAYNVKLEGDQTVASVYVNFGGAYADVGGSSTSEAIGVRLSYLSSGNVWTGISSTKYIPAVYSTSTTCQTGKNYNWVAMTTGGSYQYTCFSLSFSSMTNKALTVNEVLFLDKDGALLKATVAESRLKVATKEEVRRTVDAQRSLRKDDSYFYNFSQNEEYILYTVEGISLGGSFNKDITYPATTDYNAFGILVYALSVAVFGKSPFALRLPSFLSAFGIWIALYFLGKRTLKGDKWGVLFSAVYLLGGAFLFLGRTGVPLAFGAFLTVLSILFSYRFYAKGVDGKQIFRTALPILFSGLCAAGAVCTQTLFLFPCLVSVFIFGAGLLRQYRHCGYLLSQAEKKYAPAAAVLPVAEASESAETPEAETPETPSEAENGALSAEKSQIRREYAKKLRVSVGYALISVIALFIIGLLAELPLHGVFARTYGETGYFNLFARGFAQCLSVGDITSYTADNAFTAAGWLFAGKGATLFGKGFVGEAETVALVNAQSNVLLCVLSAVAFVYTAVRSLTAVFAKSPDKTDIRYAKAFTAITLGALASLVPFLFMQNVSALQSGTFQIFYGSYFVLAFAFMQGDKKAGEKGFMGVQVWLIVLLVLIAVLFAFTLPACFGWEVKAETAKALFGWTSVWNNGQYGVYLPASAGK